MNQTTGERPLVTAVDFFSGAYPGIAIDRRGDLLVVSRRSLLRIDSATGAQTTIVPDLCAPLANAHD